MEERLILLGFRYYGSKLALDVECEESTLWIEYYDETITLRDQKDSIIKTLLSTQEIKRIYKLLTNRELCD